MHLDLDDDDNCNRTIDGLSPNYLPVGMRRSRSLPILNQILYEIPSLICLAAGRVENLAIHRSSANVSVSSSSVANIIHSSSQHLLSVENLRLQMPSCFTCGISWTNQHFSMDCNECGDHSMERSCPLCDGKCGIMWKRDLAGSHASGQATWHGACPNYADTNNLHGSSEILEQLEELDWNPSKFSAKDLCARLEKLLDGDD